MKPSQIVYLFSNLLVAHCSLSARSLFVAPCRFWLIAPHLLFATPPLSITYLVCFSVSDYEFSLFSICFSLILNLSKLWWKIIVAHIYEILVDSKRLSPYVNVLTKDNSIVEYIWSCCRVETYVTGSHEMSSHRLCMNNHSNTLRDFCQTHTYYPPISNLCSFHCQILHQISLWI